MGKRFQLSRLVCQECPLAPYLFVFFAEAMSLFLRSQVPQIHGLWLPLGIEEELPDTEFADDTMLFVTYSEEVLDSLHDALDGFYLASGARINWAKSSGIPVGVEDVCAWGQDDGFTWLRPDQSCRYLCFQIGIDISPAQQFDPVLVCHWSSMHLSLAGRAVVVNQVLLATAWYIASCWMLHSGVISQLRRLVPNFL